MTPETQRALVEALREATGFVEAYEPKTEQRRLALLRARRALARAEKEGGA
jgi:hypothetical protein